MAVTAAQRLGLRPTYTHLDSTSVHGDGRDNSDEEPEEQVIHITRGYSREHRPDLNQVMLELIVAHQAGLPILMKPLSGNRRDAQEFGQVICAHIDQLHTTSGATYLVADSALYSEDNRQKLAHTAGKWSTRVPATLNAAQTALAQADPQTMAPLIEGYRSHALTSSDGGVEQRWVLLYSEARQPQAQRTVAKQLRKQSDKEVQALQKLCSTTFACEADAQQALATFAQGLQVTFLNTSTVRATPRDGKRGRPWHGAHPDQVVYHSEGALAASLVVRQALVNQQSCFILATNELAEPQLPPQAILEGYKGQVQAERGFRFLKAPTFLASSR
jgi:transposase